MKRFAAILILTFAISAVGQAPAATPPAPPQPTADMEKQAQLLQARGQLLYEKLRGITEFQQYIEIQQELAQLQQQYQAAQAAARTPAKEPAKK